MPPRTLPANEDAETYVLACCLGSEKAASKSAEMLRPEHFTLTRHQQVFLAITELVKRGEGIDLVTVTEELRKHGALATLMGVPYGGEQQGELDGQRFLLSLVSEVAAAGRIERYCQIVHDMWGKRELIRVFTPPMQGAWNGATPTKVIKDVEQALHDLRSSIEDDGATTVVSSFNAAQQMQDRLRQAPERDPGIGVPFSFLPRFQPGRLYVLGGYPKDGKTALAVQFLRAACQEKHKVGFVSIEMSWQDLTDRVVASFGVPYQSLQRGVIKDEHRDRFNHALGELARWQLDLIDDSAVTVSDIARYQRLGGYDYLIIDYLQRIPFRDRLELNAQVKALTTLARTAKIPILLLSQLHRPFQSDGFPRPTMNSFAETSMIEKEAAMAMAIYRHRGENGERTSEATLFVLASRYTPDGAWPVYFRPQDVSFVHVISSDDAY